MKFQNLIYITLLLIIFSCSEDDGPAFRCSVTDGSKNGGVVIHTEELNQYTNGTTGRVKNKDREQICMFASGEYIQKASDGTFRATISVFKNATGYNSPEYRITFASDVAFQKGKSYTADFWKGGVANHTSGKVTITKLDLDNDLLSITFTGEVHDGTFYPYNSKVTIFDKYVVIEQGYFEDTTFTFDAFQSQYE